MAFLVVGDLTPFASIDADKAQEMIDDATAIAVLAAPCLAEDDLTDPQMAATKAVLRGAILRWNDTGSGALTQQSAGPFAQSIDSRQQRRGMFWPSEIEQLQAICSGGDGSPGAFSIDTAPSCDVIHADICSLRFGGLYCSCGAFLTGLYPLYESTWP